MHPSITYSLPLSAPACLPLSLPLTTELIIRGICHHLFRVSLHIHRPSLRGSLSTFPSLMTCMLALSLIIERPEQVVGYLIQEVMIVKHSLYNYRVIRGTRHLNWLITRFYTRLQVFNLLLVALYLS